MKSQIFLLKDYKALGTTWYIELFCSLTEKAESGIKARIIEEIESFQNKYSRFDPDSLLNSLSKNKKVLFDTDLYNMLEYGEHCRKLTAGVFDIGIKTKLESVGYGVNKNQPSRVKEIKEHNQVSRVMSDNGYIFWNSDSEIDLGGIGKGYLIDLLADLLKKECKQDYFLINAGGDIFVTSDSGQPVEILLEHPTELSQYIGKVFLKNESLCASSSFKRTWTKSGKVHNHFIDTKEDSLVEAASFVIASNATKADVLATIVALVSNYENQMVKIVDFEKIDYLTINVTGQVFASKRFKQALKAI